MTASTTAYRLRFLTVALASSASWAPTFAADPVGWPPPGQYVIDTDETTTIGSTGVLRKSHIEGATGKVTTTVQAPGAAPQSSIAHIGKPNTWCVHANGKPPANWPMTCKTTSALASSNASSFSAQCNGADMDSRFRRIDARTWEHTLTARVTPGAGTGPGAMAAQEAAIRSAPGMTPAQRQEALNAMASARQAVGARDAAMAPVRAELEQQIRAGSPDDAAAARQELAALDRAMGRGGPAAVPSMTTQVTERWTLSGRPCDPGQ